MASELIDSNIFRDLQTKIDEESTIRDSLKEIVQKLEKQIRTAQADLARVHSTLSSQLGGVLGNVDRSITEQTATIAELATLANSQPYYKYANVWSRQVQDVITTMLLAQWLQDRQLLTLQEAGVKLSVPVNVKERDEFHITIEEYLQALISVVDELARLAVNSVTLGDYERPLQISGFIKELHAGFQLLNLKNDSLRRRSDSVKYSVKKVEDVVYDLSLRNLIPKPSGQMETS